MPLEGQGFLCSPVRLFCRPGRRCGVFFAEWMHQKCRECSRAILDPFATRACLWGSVAIWYLFLEHDLSEGLGTFVGVCLPQRPGSGQLRARCFPVQMSVLQV